MRQHQYVSTAVLNAKYKLWPVDFVTGEVMPSLQGLGAGILTQSPMGSLDGPFGALAGNYPWKADSADTEKLQRETNAALRASGYRTVLEEDGEMGPSTCGAVWAIKQSESAMPASCLAHRSEWAAPTKGDGGGGGTSRVTGAAMSDTTWLLVGGGVAVAAVGLALYMRKKKGS